MALRTAILLLSCSALGFEVLLTRLMAIVWWHHLIFWIISLALLGYGASGTFLTLLQNRLIPKWRQALFILCILLGLCYAAGFPLAQRIDFYPLEIFWDPKQITKLFSISLLLFIPFFLAGSAVGLVLSRFPREITSFYRFDLIGAGLGAISLLVVLEFIYPSHVLKILAALPWVSAMLLFPGWVGKNKWLVPAVPLSLLLLMFLFAGPVLDPIRPSPYKALSKTLLVPDTKVLAERSSPLGMLTVVQSPTIPFRLAPGLSLLSRHLIPDQLGLFLDGEGPLPLDHFTGDREAMAYLGDVGSALPYRILKKPQVLILGGGNGEDLLQALWFDASRVEVVEPNPQVLNLVREKFRNYTGDPFQVEGVETFVGGIREYVGRAIKSQKKFDLIQISLLDAFGPSAAGLLSLNENYHYTEEALQDYLLCLKPGGILSMTRWVDLPPRDGVKLFATAVEALQRLGLAPPASHLAAIRSWKTLTLLVKISPWTPGEISKIRDFSRAEGFDSVYYPGMPPTEANRYNILEQPYYYDIVQALLGPQAPSVFADYKFDIRPATDNKPFFFNFLKWKTIPEIFRLRNQGGLPLMEWGTPLLVALIAIALLLGTAFILLPLTVLRKNRATRGYRPGIILYFSALGLAFLFVEVTVLQRFILYLGHPTYAAAVVLSGFLIFAGTGSGFSGRWAGNARALVILLISVAGVGMLFLILAPLLTQKTLSFPWALRSALTLVSIAPLAFLMGMPFPLGLTLLGQNDPAAIPWAWGVNGCASVLSAPLATFLAMQWGFRWVWGLAALLYLLSTTTVWTLTNSWIPKEESSRP